MLGLQLRTEFQDPQMSGTAIELSASNQHRPSATQISPEKILKITYPTADVQNALYALTANHQAKRPIVFIGSRGRGKSHIMAVMHHAMKSPEIVEEWMHEWGKKLRVPTLEEATLLHGYLPISEAIHHHEYPSLWDLLFDRHPKGEYFRGRFATSQQPVPSRSEIEDMFQAQPVCLILDELQTWYQSLPQVEANPVQKQASNFLQILSEIAQDRPDIFILVASMLDTNSEVYQQIHRQRPLEISFSGATFSEDRQHLLLHRLFENRTNIPDEQIAKEIAVYADERCTLFFPNSSDQEKEKKRNEVIMCWPFSPELLDFLEHLIFMSPLLQDTRDFITILAQIFRTKTRNSSVITVADFYVDANDDGAQTVVNNIALGNKHQIHLKEIAQNNLVSILESGVDIPYAREMISAIWMYSLVLDKNPGIEKTQLHLAITGNSPIDNNSFSINLKHLLEQSVNIHEGDGEVLYFGEQENPRTKVENYAKNENLWTSNANGSNAFPNEDKKNLRKVLKKLLQDDNTDVKIIVPDAEWKERPWDNIDQADTPKKWRTPILFVVPDLLNRGSEESVLGKWLANNVTSRRNTVRFLLPQKDFFTDTTLLFYARCHFLSQQWKQDKRYADLASGYRQKLCNELTRCFTRFAVLHKWNFQNPENCQFDLESVNTHDENIPEFIEKKIADNIFDITGYQSRVMDFARDGKSAGELFDSLLDQGVGIVIPWLGEKSLYEHLITFAAQGIIALNVKDHSYIKEPNESTENARQRIHKYAYGNDQTNRTVLMLLPENVIIAPTRDDNENCPSNAQEKPANPNQTRENGNDLHEEYTEKKQINKTSYDQHKEYGETIPPVTKQKKTETELGSLELQSCFEKWNLDTRKILKSANLEFQNLSVEQVKGILARLPQNQQAKMTVSWTEEEKQ